MSKEKYHMDAVASTGCVICREFDGVRVDGQVHHIAQGSEERSDFMTACLCETHHTGHLGVHGMGVKAFLRLYGLSSEYHLLGLVNKFRAQDELYRR
mgnify:CR=1 FL=1